MPSQQPQRAEPHEYLGKIGTDRVTGFAGVITSYVHYLVGEDMVQVSPKAQPDGKCEASRWFSLDAIVVTPDDEAAA